MSISLQGKKILITGASSGIGKATAIACAKAGMHCVITARREQALKQLTNSLGERCSYIVGDLTKKGFNKRLLDEAGEVYAVFANAGHGLNQTMISCDLDQVKSLFDLNVFSTVELISLAAKTMSIQKNGHIIINTSCLSKFSVPLHSAYCGSKSAMESIAKAMRIELKKDNVFVSTLHPIGTKTEFFIESAKRSSVKTSEFKKEIPSWFMQPPEKVASAVVQCLKKPKAEVWTSSVLRLISTAFCASPRLAELIVSRKS